MAKLEYINLMGKIQVGVNVSAIVGVGGANLPQDVALIQAMFNYIADAGMSVENLGFYNADTRVEMTGKLDRGTRSAIERFVYTNEHWVIGGNPEDPSKSDLQIHPASYDGRVISNPATKRLMAITLLHIFAAGAAVTQGHDTYVTRLKARMNKFWP